jgi:DNA-binding response OmpR family regulator
MSLPQTVTLHKVLVVDDDEVILHLTSEQLGRKGFQVVAVGSVTEALKLITTDTFDALITDLNMPGAGDGFTVITAMRHSQPDALILLVSGYPDVERAMATIALQADEIIVKPFETAKLSELLSEKLLARQPAARTEKQRVSVILQRCLPGILTDWLAQAKLSSELNHLNLSDDERTGYLPKLIADLIVRLDETGSTPLNDAAPCSSSAAEHGKLRFRQGYSSPMLVHESRILQVTLFGTLQNNLSHIDFSLLLPDVMKIADEVDAQLTQAMTGFTEGLHAAVAA